MAVKAGKLVAKRLFGGTREVMNYDIVSLGRGCIVVYVGGVYCRVCRRGVLSCM